MATISTKKFAFVHRPSHLKLAYIIMNRLLLSSLEIREKLGNDGFSKAFREALLQTAKNRE